MPTTILNIAIATPLRHCFDYLPPADCQNQVWQAGMRIKVPFGKREVTGILLGTTTQTTLPNKKLRQALAVLDDQTLFTSVLLRLLQRVSDYYHHPIGEVFATALPTWLRQGKAANISKRRLNLFVNSFATQSSKLKLSAAQTIAVQQITAALDTFQPFLLYGVTGSGKTEVYLQVIEQVLQAGRQALILVPEIGLTPQIIERFQTRFAVPIAILHSGLTERERVDYWLLAQTGQASIIIGTRSAIFTPLPKLGMIIVDEEHDLSFKQQEGLRYSARDIAVWRAQLEQVPVVLGSATPALESWQNVKRERYQLLTLPERAGAAVHPQFHIIDLRNQYAEHGLSKNLLARIQQHLAADGQVLLFINRRGYAPSLLCHHCGWALQCARCSTHMIMHQQPRQMQCHHCGSTHAIPTKCEACQQHTLQPLGLGTERVEQALAEHFPDTPLIRIDRDSTRRKGSLEDKLNSIQQGGARLLIGTQMLAKGHHFPEVTLVALINVDSGFYSGEFHATERVAQLILQVAGRAGRADKPGEVIIQTHHPQHPLLLQLLQQDYAHFAELALAERAAAEWPPFCYLALVRAEANKMELPLAFLTQLKQIITRLQLPISCLGPIPAPLEKRAGHYRAQLLLQSPQRGLLQQSLQQLIPHIENEKSARLVRWSIDVDPQDMS